MQSINTHTRFPWNRRYYYASRLHLQTADTTEMYPPGAATSGLDASQNLSTICGPKCRMMYAALCLQQLMDFKLSLTLLLLQENLSSCGPSRIRRNQRRRGTQSTSMPPVSTPHKMKLLLSKSMRTRVSPYPRACPLSLLVQR